MKYAMRNTSSTNLKTSEFVMRAVIAQSPIRVWSGLCLRLFDISAVIRILFLAVVLSGQARATNWSNTTGVPDPWYHVGSNWSGGVPPGNNETANFHQTAEYEVWWDNTTATLFPSAEFMSIVAGEVTFLNRSADTRHIYVINGSGGTGNYSDFSISGSSTTLINRGLSLVSLGSAQILDGATLILDGSHAQGAEFALATWLKTDGTLNVKAGAHASLPEIFIGSTPASTGEVRITGNSSTLTTGAVYVGQVDQGTFHVEAGAVVTGFSGYMGSGLGSTGVARVAGTGSRWNNYRDLFVGRSGNGTLTVEAGGVVTNETGWIGSDYTAIGEVNVTGPGSQWNNSRDVEVGGLGHGTLNVEAGGVVNSGFSNIALFGTGMATVTGIGSQWNNSTHLSVGRYDHGTLDVEAGGVVNSSRGSIGRNSYGQSIGKRVGTGVARVTGPGSAWNVTASLSVGSGGHATLHIEAGGVVNSAQGYIGESPVPEAPDSTATATVAGSDSMWNISHGLYLGGTDAESGAKGNLNVIDNGLIRVGAGLKIWETGALNLDGGTVQAETIDHTHGGEFNFLSGTLDVGIFDGNLIQSGGTMSVGRSSGITTVTGSYNQIDGAIEIGIFPSAGGSPVPGIDYEQLIADSVTLSGTLALVVDSNFAPVVGNSLTIINTTGGVSGKFSDANNVVLPGGLSLEVLYGTHDVKLAVVPEPSSYALIAFGLLVARVRARACLRRSLCRRGAHHNRITMEK